VTENSNTIGLKALKWIFRWHPRRESWLPA